MRTRTKIAQCLEGRRANTRQPTGAKPAQKRGCDLLWSHFAAGADRLACRKSQLGVIRKAESISLGHAGHTIADGPAQDAAENVIHRHLHRRT